MGRIGPRRNRREVAGPAAGPIRPMADRTLNLQPAAIFHIHPIVETQSSMAQVVSGEFVSGVILSRGRRIY